MPRSRTVAFVLVASVVLLSFGAAPLVAQSNVSTGALQGTITDGQGGVLPGVSVEAKVPATGFSRRSVTDAKGTYRFDFLPVGIYSIRAELEGFRPEVKQGIDVNLGAAVNVNFTLQLGTLTEEVVVTAATPLVQTTQPDVASSVGERQIADLPLNGRDFLDFVALTPQSTVDDNQRLHIGGQRGIQNSFNIDGASTQSNFFGEERGGTRPPFTFSQAAIKEFQVIPSSYNVQFGNASGGIINAITKSGTNQLHGEAWYYFRNESFINKDALGRESPKFNQKQFGASLGGPIIKDKLHYFVSYDGQRKDFPVYRFFYGFPADRTAEWESLTGLNYADEVGNVTSTDNADVFLGKVDWQISPSVLLSFRDNYTKYKAENGVDTSYADTGRSNNGTEEDKFNSAVVNLNTVLTESIYNEFIFQYSKEERPRYANSTVPQVRIGQYTYDAMFGRKDYLPNNTIEKHNQFIDNFTYFMGNHALKAGFNIDLVKYDDDFYRYAGGSFQYKNWNDFFNGVGYRYTQAFSDYNGIVKFDTNYYSGYLQDEWRVSPKLTVTYGIRYDFQDNPQPDETNSAFPATGSVPNDHNNWAPRVGFAWDPTGEGRTVVRGGFGYFYDNTPTLLLANALLNNGIRVVRVDLTCAYAPCPTFPNIIGSLGDLPGAKPSIYVFKPGFQNPETKRWSVGVEQQLANNYTVGADVIWSQTTHLERMLDLNLVPVGFTPYGVHTYDYRNVNYPGFGSIAQFVDDARSEYFAIVLKARKRWADNWMFDFSYTYSKSKDNNSNERTVTVGDYSSGEDPLNIGDNWGYSDFDVRHKFVASAVVMLPYDFQFSTIATIRSGYPYTPYDDRCWNASATGSCLDPFSVSYRAYYGGIHYARNSFRQPWYHRVDVRLSKMFKIAGQFEIEILGEAFNVFNSANLRTTRTTMVDSNGNKITNFGSVAKDNSPIVGDPRQYQLGVKLRF